MPSDAELLQLAFESEEDASWEAIRALHHRATKEIFEAAAAKLSSERPQSRSRAAMILAQLGIPKRAFPDQSLAVLTETLAREQEPSVVASLVIAVGHLHDERIIPSLLPLGRHTNAEVRYAVASSLHGLPAAHTIETLILLSCDPSPKVRDWACFAIANADVDSSATRDALLARVRDDDLDTKSEAIAGLCRRRDARVVPLLIELLESNGSIMDDAMQSILALDETELRSRDDWNNVDWPRLQRALEKWRC